MNGLARQDVHRAITLARRAPSAHNTQPWRVRVTGDRVLIEGDERRHLSHGDPARRDLTLGLGGFVEAVRIAFAEDGWSCGEAETSGGVVTLAPTRDRVAPEAREAASLLRRRQSSRLPYSPRALPADELLALERFATSRGLRLVIASPAERPSFTGWFYAAARESWLDVRSTAELSRWLRFDPEGVRPPVDGLSTECLGLSPTEAVAMTALTRAPLWRAANAMYAAAPLASALAKKETQLVEAAPSFIVVVGSLARDAGAALLSWWLEATRLHIAVHPVSVLLDRRGWEVARHLGVAPSELLFAARIGKSAAPPWSGRRSVSDIAC